MAIQDAVDILRENGVAQLGRRTVVKLYRDFVRPRLPKREYKVSFNSVEIRTMDVCVFDSIVPWVDSPWYTSDNPNYEGALVDAVRKNVGHGDSVVVVGGG